MRKTLFFIASLVAPLIIMEIPGIGGVWGIAWLFIWALTPNFFGNNSLIVSFLFAYLATSFFVWMAISPFAKGRKGQMITITDVAQSESSKIPDFTLEEIDYFEGPHPMCEYPHNCRICQERYLI